MANVQPKRPEPAVHALPPGTTRLGGAAAGLSYEGALRDALARDERPAVRERPKPLRRKAQ